MGRRRTIVEEFDPKRVRPLPGQPRKRFRGITELAESIREIGQSCPGLVTLVDDDPAFDAQLVDGERRLRACIKAGVPFRAEVRAAGDAEEIFVASFAANFGKQDHDAIEIAEGLDRMKRAGKTYEQLARIAGKSVGWVGQHLQLLKLHPSVQAMMAPAEDGEEEVPRLTFMVAQLLAPMDEKSQITAARKIVAGGGMGLAAARRMVLKLRSRAGDDSAYAGARTRARSIATVKSIVKSVEDRIGVYLDMPGSQINAMIDAVSEVQRRHLVEAIEECTDSLEGLAEAIKSRMTKRSAAMR